MRSMKLRTSMILCIWAVAAAILLAILWVDFITTKESVEDEIEENAIDLAKYYSKRVDEILAEIVATTRVVAKQMEIQYKLNDIDRNETLELYIKNIVDSNPFIDCAVIGFEPYAYDKNIEKYAPYYYENNYRFNEEDYNYFEREWYKGPKESGKPVWTEPYYAYDDNTMMMTYSEPFFKDGKFMGAVGLDVTLERLRNEIGNLKLLDTGYGFVVSKDGFLISYPDKTKGLGNNISELSRDLAGEIDKLITLKPEEWILLKMKDPLRQKKSWIVLRPLRTHSNRLLGIKTIMGSVGFVYPEKEILSIVYALQRKAIYTAIIGLILLLIIIIIISNSISRPITRLAEGVMRVARGDLDYQLSAKTRFSEVDKLQAAFNKMSADLKAYIKNLKEEIETRERIDSELKIARQIQTSMIPRTFPPFPHRKEFELFGSMDPAREVGGDIYDFFLVDENRLCFLIGDVSGKGIPAALFMVIIKILLKNEAGNGLLPDEILYRVNNLLCPDNDECMFATIFCAVLDIRTGEVQFANAGHNPPLIGRKTETGYSFEFMNVNSNFVVGAKPGTGFALEKTKLNRGDIIFLYTDGVTEAMNHNSEYFSENRLKEALSRLKDEEVGRIISNIQGRISAFTMGADQSDDITMLVLRYTGPA